MLNIVLHEPEIAENTGNIGRTCVCAGAKLHIIEPTKFRLTKEYIRRSGLDYWERLNFIKYINYIDFLVQNDLFDTVNVDEKMVEKNKFIFEEIKNSENIGGGGNKINNDKNNFMETILEDGKTKLFSQKKDIIKPTLYFATTKAHKRYTDVKFNDGDFIMFGKESAGIPEEILAINEENCIRIPMAKDERSLNLANSVAIVLYEALRQVDFLQLEGTGELHRLKYNEKF